MFNEFISPKDLPLFTGGGFLAMSKMYIQEGMKDVSGTFDVFVRNLPANRNYLVFGGLEAITDYLTTLKFNKEQLAFLHKAYGFSGPVLDYFKKYRFTGDLHSVKEGTVFFANEPVMRITAPLIEAQLIERYLLNSAIAYTVFSTKASRFIQSVKKGTQTGLNFTRAQGPQASLICLRAARAVGLDITACPIFSLKNDAGSERLTITHSFITSFATEEQALRTYSKYAGKGSLWLLDTYDSIKGLDIYIKVAKELKAAGKKYPTTIMFDSGDLAVQTKIARKRLNLSGLKNVKIILVSNLDEYKMKKLYARGAVGDLVVGGEEITTSPDAPKLEFVMKLAELINDREVIPKMKLSSGKVSYPGRKQVYRHKKDGLFSFDYVGLEGENISGEKLLQPIIKRGKMVTKLPNLEKIADHHRSQISRLPARLLRIDRSAKYQVKMSPELKKLAQKTKREIIKVHHEI